MRTLHIAPATKPVALYAVDVIISVGYRDNSQRTAVEMAGLRSQFATSSSSWGCRCAWSCSLTEQGDAPPGLSRASWPVSPARYRMGP